MILKNFSSGVLATGIGTGDVTITVVAGSTLPSTAGTFTATIWDNVTYTDPSKDPNAEIILGVYASPNTYTITRAQESTSAVAHSAGAVVGLYLTAGAIVGAITSQVVLLGAFVDKSSSYGAQQAATDGFVVVSFGMDQTNSYVRIESDAANPPTTIRAIATETGFPFNSSMMVPIKKNDYWMIEKSSLGGENIISVYWIPLGL